MRRLEGKVILVAGAGAIGAELARRYAAEKACVVLGDVDVTRARDAAAEIARAGGRIIAVKLDGTDESSIAAAVSQCRESCGGLDGLHANFAMFEDVETDIGVMELDLETFDRVMQVNVRGFLLCTRHALPEMIARGGGAILYTGSIAAYTGGPRRVAYAMSKSAILALMRHVASRYGSHGIRANVIVPGFIMRADQEDVFRPEVIQRAKDSALLKSRIGDPADVAALSAMLMSDEGSFITGQSIAVDGGVTLRP
jgi:NAD(P)-dependent dehydrogenase (short-subunit alcohol dehydrogenase family)